MTTTNQREGKNETFYTMTTAKMSSPLGISIRFSGASASTVADDPPSSEAASGASNDPTTRPSAAEADRRHPCERQEKGGALEEIPKEEAVRKEREGEGVCLAQRDEEVHNDGGERATAMEAIEAFASSLPPPPGPISILIGEFPG